MEGVRKTAAANAGYRKRRKKTNVVNADEEAVLRRAQVYLLFEAKRPMLWTVAGIRKEKNCDGGDRWIVNVNLRYPTGFEGYLGDLLVEGDQIIELTDLDTMRERARRIEADLEGAQRWHEYRDSVSAAGEA